MSKSPEQKHCLIESYTASLNIYDKSTRIILNNKPSHFVGSSHQLSLGNSVHDLREQHNFPTCLLPHAAPLEEAVMLCSPMPAHSAGWEDLSTHPQLAPYLLWPECIPTVSWEGLRSWGTSLAGAAPRPRLFALLKVAEHLGACLGLGTHRLLSASADPSWPPPAAAQRTFWLCGSRSHTCSCTGG